MLQCCRVVQWGQRGGVFRRILGRDQYRLLPRVASLYGKRGDGTSKRGSLRKLECRSR